MLFGSMGSIGDEARVLLASEGFHAVYEPFPQNVFRDESGYRRALVRALAVHRPDAVLPVGNPLAMSRFKGLVERGIPLCDILNCREPELSEEDLRKVEIVVEKEETIRILDSKVDFYEFARKLGLRQPETYSGAGDIPEGLKVVFKRDISYGGHGVHLPRSVGALKNLIAHQSPGEGYLIEEYIEGRDCSLDAVRYGDIFRCRVYESLAAKGNGPAGIRKVLAGAEPFVKEMEICAGTVLDALDYQGVCGFDFRVDNGGMVYLLECNPRFTGGVSVQAAAGFNIPALLVSSVFSCPYP